MTHLTDHPAGAPCWIETLQPDPIAAQRFYGALLGWRGDAPQPMPAGIPGSHVTARLGGRRVAAVAQAPPGMPAAAWLMYIAVENLEESLGRARRLGGTVRLAPSRLGADGRLAILADTGGVVVGMWEPGRRGGVEVVDEAGTWTMSVLHTTDSVTAEAFYGPTFGWRLQRFGNGPAGLWRLTGHRGPTLAGLPEDVVAVTAPADPPTIPAHWAVSVLVDDVDATLAEAVELGASVVVAPTDAAGLRTAALRDPQGAVLSITAQPTG